MHLGVEVDGDGVHPAAWRASGWAHLIPSSIEEIVDKVVPELQERGAYRAEYTGTTLREHLALPAL